MAPEIALLLLLDWQPLPCCPPPGTPYPQLPAEKICELCYQQCEADEQVLAAMLEVVGGWQREQFTCRKAEARRLASVWYAAWWVSWDRATPDQREEWAERLADCIGIEDFWVGNIPLPLSVR